MKTVIPTKQKVWSKWMIETLQTEDLVFIYSNLLGQKQRFRKNSFVTIYHHIKWLIYNKLIIYLSKIKKI